MLMLQNEEIDLWDLLINSCLSPRKTHLSIRFMDPTCSADQYSTKNGEGVVHYSSDNFIQIEDIRLFIGGCSNMSCKKKP